MGMQSYVEAGSNGHSRLILVEDRPSLSFGVVPNTYRVVVVDAGRVLRIPIRCDYEVGIRVAVGRGVVNVSRIFRNALFCGLMEQKYCLLALRSCLRDGNQLPYGQKPNPSHCHYE